MSAQWTEPGETLSSWTSLSGWNASKGMGEFQEHKVFCRLVSSDSSRRGSSASGSREEPPLVNSPGPMSFPQTYALIVNSQDGCTFGSESPLSYVRIWKHQSSADPRQSFHQISAGFKTVSLSFSQTYHITCSEDDARIKEKWSFNIPVMWIKLRTSLIIYYSIAFSQIKRLFQHRTWILCNLKGYDDTFELF